MRRLFPLLPHTVEFVVHVPALLLLLLLSGTRVWANNDNVRIMDVRIQKGSGLVVVRVEKADGTPRRDLAAHQFHIFTDSSPTKNSNSRTGWRELPVTSVKLLKLRKANLALTICLDTSGSMRKHVAEAQAAVGRWLKVMKPEDVVSVLSFDDRSQVILNFTPNRDVAREVVGRALTKSGTSRGNTALFDAIDAARNAFANQPLKRQAILLITDGEDNASNLSASDLQRLKSSAPGAPAMPPIFVASGIGDEKPRLNILAEETGGGAEATDKRSSPNALLNQIRFDSYIVNFQLPSNGQLSAFSIKAGNAIGQYESPVAAPTSATSPQPNGSVPAASPAVTGESRSSWPLISGRVAALVFVGVFLWFVARRTTPSPPNAGKVVRRAVLVNMDMGGQQVTLVASSNSSRLVFGRGQEADIRIIDDEASRRHAEFLWDGRTWNVTDLSSTNGVMVNGIPMRRTSLKNGDRLKMGTHVWEFNDADVDKPTIIS